MSPRHRARLAEPRLEPVGPRRPAIRSVAAAIVLAAGLVAQTGAAGCASTGEGSSRVERGESVTTGNTSYDDFFKQVESARSESEKADKDVKEARAALAKALELDPKAATFEVIIEQTADRAKKLRDRGVSLHLEITPDAKLVSSANKPLDPWGEDLLHAIEDASKKSLTLARRMLDLSSRAAALQKTRAELLEGAGSLGAGASDVTRELKASESVIDSIASRGAKQAGNASRFLIAVGDALDAAGGSAVKVASRPAGASASGKSLGKAPGRPTASSGGAAGATPPAAKPKPASKSDDFEP